MGDCECLAKCPFFNDKMANMPSMAVMMKKRYCHEDFESCARHRVFVALGRDAVPSDLFPNQDSAATEIVSAA